MFKREDLLISWERNAVTVTGHHIQADHWLQEVRKTLFEFRSLWLEVQKKPVLRSQDLGIAREALTTILTDDLNLHPYRTQVKQKLTEGHIMQKRVDICEWIIGMIGYVLDFLSDTWFSDGAHVCLSGHVNWKNNVYRGSQPPDMVLQRPLHSVRCSLDSNEHAWHHRTFLVWGWLRTRPLGKHRQRCIEVFGKLLGPLGTQRGLGREAQWFQQDGANPIAQGSRWIGWLVPTLETGWSVRGFSWSGPRIHLILHPWTSIFGATWKIGCS